MSGTVLHFPGPDERGDRIRRRELRRADEGTVLLDAEAEVVHASLELLTWAEETGDLSGLPPQALTLLDRAKVLSDLYHGR